ncbi:hypothetical protein MMC11_001602 [Xylographa trunciseda]|nr:hypothetical protein [Xylographa trunciseda]
MSFGKMFLSSTILVIVLQATIAAALSGLLEPRTTCSTPDGSGTCQSTSSCTTFSVAGYCSGAASNQCCVQQSCSAGGGSGICKNTANGCAGGTFYSGACPGSSSIECCVTASGSGGNVAAFDISSSQTSAFWSCAAQTYQKAVIRGYYQACASGGAVDPDFVGSYNAARAAGITNIDAYMFACTGTQPTGVACKPPSTQLSEFQAVIQSNNMALKHLWFDVEPASGACNAWNLGSSQNLALAQQWTALLRQSSYKWGIYGNGNQWTSMFASRSTDIGSDLPLWAVQDDGTPGVATVTTFMGGWTSAYAKQYDLDTTGCGGSVDLDSFTA